MRKIKAFLLSFFLIAALTGCVRFDATINVKRNGKMDIAISYAVLDVTDREVGEILSDEQIEEYKDDGWDVEEFKDGGYSGYIIKKKDVPVSELENSNKNKKTALSDELKSLKLTRKGMKYTLDWDIAEEAKELSAASEYSDYVKMSGAQMKVKINLPSKAVKSNATHVSEDGRSYEWDLLNFDDPDGIHLEYKLIDTKMMIAGVVSLAVLIAVVTVIIVMLRKKKKAKAESNE